MATLDKFLDLFDSVERRVAGDFSLTLAAVMERLALAQRDEGRTAALTEPDRRLIFRFLRTIWRDAISGTDVLMSEMLGGQKASPQQLLDAYIAEAGATRAAQILQTTEKQIRDLIAGGLASGNAADEVYSQLFSRIEGLADIRATLITRTEVHAASQFTAFRLAINSSLPLTKVWNSVKDDRTRNFGLTGRVSQFNHWDMDQERVPLMANFLVPARVGGSEALAFPGDPRGSAGNVINCRCIATYERNS